MAFHEGYFHFKFLPTVETQIQYIFLPCGGCALKATEKDADPIWNPPPFHLDIFTSPSTSSHEPGSQPRLLSPRPSDFQHPSCWFPPPSPSSAPHGRHVGAMPHWDTAPVLSGQHICFCLVSREPPTWLRSPFRLTNAHAWVFPLPSLIFLWSLQPRIFYFWYYPPFCKLLTCQLQLSSADKL